MCVDVTTSITTASGDDNIICVRCRSNNKTKIFSSSSSKLMFDRTSSSIICLESFIMYFLRLLDMCSTRNYKSSTNIFSNSYFTLYSVCYSLWKFYSCHIYGSSKRILFCLQNSLLIIRVSMSNHQRKNIPTLVYIFVQQSEKEALIQMMMMMMEMNPILAPFTLRTVKIYIQLNWFSTIYFRISSNEIL
jgi:hypothetical protein